MYISIAGLSHKPQHTTPRGQPRFGYVHKVHKVHKHKRTKCAGRDKGGRWKLWPEERPPFLASDIKIAPTPHAKKTEKRSEKRSQPNMHKNTPKSQAQLCHTAD